MALVPKNSPPRNPKRPAPRWQMNGGKWTRVKWDGKKWNPIEENVMTTGSRQKKANLMREALDEAFRERDAAKAEAGKIREEALMYKSRAETMLDMLRRVDIDFRTLRTYAAKIAYENNESAKLQYARAMANGPELSETMNLLNEIEIFLTMLGDKRSERQRNPSRFERADGSGVVTGRMTGKATWGPPNGNQVPRDNPAIITTQDMADIWEHFMLTAPNSGLHRAAMTRYEGWKHGK